jgi:hypothetical protein
MMGAHSEVPEIEIISGGSLSVTDWVRLGNWGTANAMSVRVDGGSLSVGGEFTVAEWEADADVELSSGSIVAGSTKVGNDGSSSKTGEGIMSISGGTYNSDFGSFEVGVRSKGTLNMSDGTLSVDPSGNGWNPLRIGVGAGDGTVNLTGGNINIGLLEMEYNEADDAGTAQLNLLGGVLQIENPWAAAVRVEDQSKILFDEGELVWKGDMVGNVDVLVAGGFVEWAGGKDVMLTENWEASWTDGNSVLYADYDDVNPGYTTVWATAIPEPSTLGMMALLGGGILAMRRIKK